MFYSFSFCNNHPKGSIPRSHPAMVSRFSGVRNPLCCSISCLPRPATRAPQPAKPSLLSPAARLSSAKRPFYPRAGKDKALLPDTMQVPGPISPPAPCLLAGDVLKVNPRGQLAPRSSARSPLLAHRPSFLDTTSCWFLQLGGWGARTSRKYSRSTQPTHPPTKTVFVL